MNYCCEDISLIENYEIAVNSPEKYDCHHKLEIQGNNILSVKELKEQNLYYKRPAKELIFLTHKEHCRIHGKLRCPNKGHIPGNKGKHYFNNGIIEMFALDCPEGFVKGRLPRNEQWSKRISKSRLANPIPQTPELLLKLRNSHLGKELSEQAKEKLSESSKGRKFLITESLMSLSKNAQMGLFPEDYLTKSNIRVQMVLYAHQSHTIHL